MTILEKGTRVLIKSNVQMGIRHNAYLFADIACKHLFVYSISKAFPDCYILCPEDELDGERDALRLFNQKRPHHVTVPVGCFVVDPVTEKPKRPRKVNPNG